MIAPLADEAGVSREPSMPWIHFAAVGVGAVLGAWLRWGLSALLNPVHPSIPLGTLTANLVGGFLIGVVMGVAEPLGLTAATRLFLVTGFLGALTTFSSFSAETVGLFLKGEAGWSILLALAHLAGSLLLTGGGILIARMAIGR
jgi:CrcB protein